MRRPHALVVDDDPAVTDYLSHALKDEFDVRTASDPGSALASIRGLPIDLVFLDMTFGTDRNAGLNLIPQIKELDISIEIIVITAGFMPDTAFEAGRRGAIDFVQKPITEEQLLRLKHAARNAIEKRALNREALFYRKDSEERQSHEILFQSAAMRAVMKIVREVAPTDSAVLISGETGTGKELVARAIHRTSARSKRPFVAVHLAAVPDTLLESDLFGHEKGAFTGATGRRMGRFELADSGTLFFDEIGTMPPQVQVRLLRVLQEREVQRVGGEKNFPVDVRVISATNLDIRKAVDDGRFRADLYYRLHTVPILIPPLRERVDDIPMLAESFLKDFSSRYRKAFQSISGDALELLARYSWPGNVRELQHLVERIVSTQNADVLKAEHLPLDVLVEAGPSNGGRVRLKDALERTERQLIHQALSDHANNQSRAADALGIDRTTLIYKMKKLGVRSDAA